MIDLYNAIGFPNKGLAYFDAGLIVLSQAYLLGDEVLSMFRGGDFNILFALGFVAFLGFGINLLVSTTRIEQ